MVAYSFRPRFAAPIIDGMKCQTIRAPRRRHAKPGEQLQLYTGMRTRRCRLIARAECASIHEIEIVTLASGLLPIEVDRVPIGCDIDAFARADGFRGSFDMWDFWREMHGLGVFSGVLIRWQPLARCASAETATEQLVTKSLTR